MHTKKCVVLGLLLMLISCPTWAQTQRMAIPSYFGPGPLWTKLGDASPRVGMATINPNSGPGDAVQQDYVAQVKAVQAQGVTVLGYVHTSYGKRPIAEVQAEIDKYRLWYGVDGIFLDEVTNDDTGLPYYVQCRTAVRAGHSKAVIVINPGTPVTEGYMAVANVVVTFESDYDTYLKRAPDAVWVSHYPAKRFLHLIFAVPDIGSMQKAVQLGKQRHAGWFYATPDTLPNPWDTLPDGVYWTGELAALGSH